MEARGRYESRRQELEQELEALRVRYDALAWSRLAVLTVAIAGGVLTLWKDLGVVGWSVTLGASLAFVVLVYFHGRVANRRDRLEAAKRYNERGLERLQGKWMSFEDDGARYLRDDHPYALDLDIFGAASLFQLLNDTRTRMGARRLATWLAGPAPDAAITTRQRAVKELGEVHGWRESIAVAGAHASETSPDPEPLLAWGERPPVLPPAAWPKAAAWLGTISVIAVAIACSHPAIPGWVFLIPYAVNMTVTILLTKKLQPVIEAVSERAEDLERYGEMLALVEEQSFESEGLRALQERLRATGIRSSEEIRRLARIVSILDARRNGAFRALIGPGLLWDLHCAFALERWQSRAGKGARGWLRALADIEALASMGTFCFEHPSFTFPSIEAGPLHFRAEGLGHPLINDDVRVVNDVTLPDPGSVLLVTGSNMSGKSTLLRSMGIAAVLALAGAPVCARSLRMSGCVLRTSMRVSDSLKDGISRFYAELLKIKQVTQTAEQGTPVLFLLDEILHGTNSRERHIGARSIIRTLVDCGSMGAVSTHDLALASLADELPERVQLVHLQEQVVDGKMVFDYRLREGVVKSGNALRWMRHVGLRVDEPAGEPSGATPEPPVNSDSED
jgi:ABC-type multidrug transport system fused ATPase/permease subunit